MDINEIITKYLDENHAYFEHKDNMYVYTIEADYRDKIEPKQLKQICAEVDRESAFYELIDEAYLDAFADYENDILDDFKKWYAKQNCGIDVNDVVNTLSENFDDFIRINPDYNHFLNQAVNTLLILDTGDANYDFSLNPNDSVVLYGIDDLSDEDIKLLDKSSLVFLLNQCGYSKNDLLELISSEGDTSDAFLKSVYNEIVNATSSMNAFVVLSSNTVEDLINFSNCDSVTVAKSAVCGLFDMWNGGGSILEIELPKELKISTSNIYNFIPDEGSTNAYGYTVSNVYGMTGSCYESGAVTID